MNKLLTLYHILMGEMMMLEKKDKDNNESTWKGNNCVNREHSIKIIDNCLTVDEKGLDGDVGGCWINSEKEWYWFTATDIEPYDEWGEIIW